MFHSRAQWPQPVAERRERPGGEARPALRSSAQYSAESTRVLAAEYAPVLRTTKTARRHAGACAAPRLPPRRRKRARRRTAAPIPLPTRRMPKTTKEGKKKRKETKKPSPVNSAKTRPMNGSNAISRCPATELPRLFPAWTPDARSVCAGHEGKSPRRGCCAASHTSGRP